MITQHGITSNSYNTQRAIPTSPSTPFYIKTLLHHCHHLQQWCMMCTVLSVLPLTLKGLRRGKLALSFQTRVRFEEWEGKEEVGISGGGTPWVRRVVRGRQCMGLAVTLDPNFISQASGSCRGGDGWRWSE